METGVLNIPAPVRMTPCPPRLQLQTLWIGVILTGKMTFWGDKFLTKVDMAMKTGVLNFVDRDHLDKENYGAMKIGVL